MNTGALMSETTRMLDDLVVALEAGDDERLLAALGQAAVDIQVDSRWHTIKEAGRRTAVMNLLAGFDDVTVTPVHRTTTPSAAIEQVVVSGRHVGRFAGVEPSGERVRMNVSATAVSAADGSVSRLRITPDLAALTDPGAVARGSFGTAAALQAAFRENEAREVRGWQDTSTIVADRPAHAAPPAPPKPGRRRTRVLGVAVVLAALLAGGAYVVRPYLFPASTPSALAPTTAAPSASAAPTPTPSATPTPTPTASVPVIATAEPSVAPTVQEGKQLTLTSDVLFALGSSELTPSARRALLDLAADIRDAEVEGTVQVNGYTDDVGTPASNLTLSRDRALAVARVLQPALAGMPVTLQPQGFGEASPVASNTTAAGRAKNRRVTVVLPRS